MTKMRVVRILCPGGFVGEAVSATGFFKMRCREQRCRAPDGSRPVHVWDMETGWLVDEQSNETTDMTAESAGKEPLNG